MHDKPPGPDVRRGRIPGVVEFRPPVHEDHRGRFVTTFLAAEVRAATGADLRIEQASSSRSRAGVVRGIHYTRTPPGVRKYVTCAAGAIRDFAVDLRVGSPTFGRWESVVLTAKEANAAYLPVGVGHAFEALEDDSVMSYLLTRSYEPADELTVSLLDPELGLPFRDLDPALLSDRDRSAPTLHSAAERGLLPDWADSLRLERGEER
jgi:5-epimerase